MEEEEEVVIKKRSKKRKVPEEEEEEEEGEKKEEKKKEKPNRKPKSKKKDKRKSCRSLSPGCFTACSHAAPATKTGYRIFCDETKTETKGQGLSKISAEWSQKWKLVPPHEKAVYHAKAAAYNKSIEVIPTVCFFLNFCVDSPPANSGLRNTRNWPSTKKLPNRRKPKERKSPRSQIAYAESSRISTGGLLSRLWWVQRKMTERGREMALNFEFQFCPPNSFSNAVVSSAHCRRILDLCFGRRC